MGERTEGREAGPDEKKNEGKVVSAEAYSGYRGNERPLAFEVQGKRLSVRRILERRRTPGFEEFRVEVEDGGLYWIAWDRTRDLWVLR